MIEELAQRFGRWAVIAGASEGLGAAFARALARRGMDLVLVARRAEPLEELATRLRAELAVEVRTVALDLGAPDAIEQLHRSTATLEIGLAIYNAAYAPIGDVVATAPEDLLRVVDVNVRAPLLFARSFAAPMVVRRRGAIVLVSSVAGMQGTPRLSTYAASKAFLRVLGEGMWGELRRSGVEVLVVTAGAIRTPGYKGASKREAPGTLDPDEVALRTIAAIGRGPNVIPGWLNRIAAWIVGRLFPRRLAIATMAASTSELR
ncbi:MAG TPA: SDR family NAD(P)-dependent oxidoreductase [Nannocystaceae bacterium]|nr:SDR family NAD(P)-dependent oxidoreductase [Nannocystaceae bacterium]